jgi:hypothetical protein
MATIRVSTLDVQVDDTLYTFDTPENADAFEACVATVDQAYCESTILAVSKRPVSADPRIPTTSLE